MHFQRGLLRALAGRGHTATAWEPVESWSRANLAADQGPAALDGFASEFPDLSVRRYAGPGDLEAAIAVADVVIVHEWTDPAIVAALGRWRRRGRFSLLFHDTHHRAVSDPAAMRGFDLSEYDAVLAFGATLAEIYAAQGWGGRAFVFHEAADLRLFRPPAVEAPRRGAIWIGNWGDGERTSELETFLLRPAREAGVSLDINGVRYPPEALAMLARHGARYHGWIANAAVPAAFAPKAATVHVPRRYYSQMLPGIPTIRVFEALACGIPLLSAPWNDCESLFRIGRDFLMARDGDEMTSQLRNVANDKALAAELVANGIETIRTRHSCDVRAGELLDIVGRLAPRTLAARVSA